MAESLRLGVNEEADQFVRRFYAILVLLQRNKISKKEVIQRLIQYSDTYSCEAHKFSEFEGLPKHFQIYYQLTMDDDLSRFDSMYSPDNITSEKSDIGLKLMERRKIFIGQDNIFENSSERKIAVYYPRDDDNINYEQYSYPRAVIHTARPLSNLMLQRKMMSALRLNFDWKDMTNEANLMNFFDALNTNNDALQGFDDVKRNPSIMYLVAIPKIAPHTYLNLSKTEALIFIIFNMINDIVVNLILRITNQKVPLKTDYTTYTISKLHNLAITFTNLDSYSNAIIYAIKVCLINRRLFAIFKKSFNDMVKTELIKDMLNSYTYARITDLDILRENVNGEDINQFIRLFYRIALKRIERQADPKSEIIRKNEIKSKKDETEQVCKAHESSSKTANGKIKRVRKDFQQFFSSVDHDFKRFDRMYSSDNITSEKVELGLQLMKREKTFKDFIGQHKTFEISSKKAITVYFPIPKDTSYKEYLYSKAIIHTARPLSNLMLKRKMMSALGLSIGWEGMTNEANLNRFLNMLEEDPNLYFNNIRGNLSIMYLVTIPKITPHKYLNLSKAEALIFITFNIIRDSVTNFKLQMSNPNTPLKDFTANFTAETISKVNDYSISFIDPFYKLTNLKSYTNIIEYAANVCITNIMHKGLLSNATED